MFTSSLAGVELPNRSPTSGSLSLLVIKISAVIRELLSQLPPLKNWTFRKIHSSLLLVLGDCESLSRDFTLARMRKSWYPAASSAVDTPFAGVMTCAEAADDMSKRAMIPFVMAVVVNFIVVVFLCAFPDDERREEKKS
jgi:hypothetical protein